MRCPTLRPSSSTHATCSTTSNASSPPNSHDQHSSGKRARVTPSCAWHVISTANSKQRKANTMANDITITNSNDLALLGEAANDLTAGDMVGVSLKYVRGVWKKKNTDDFVNVSPTQQFIVDMLSY